VANAVFGSHFFRLLQIAADQRDDLDTGYVFDAVQVFDAEGTGAGEGNFDGFHVCFIP
jgi:hypothetical protein